MADNILLNNKANQNGGVISLTDQIGTTAFNREKLILNFEHNQMTKNSALSLGGAYYQSGGTSSVLDNLFNNNLDLNGDQVVISQYGPICDRFTPGL